MVKLTENEVLSIRAASGRTQDDLAKQFGVTRQNINIILNRKSWSHI